MYDIKSLIVVDLQNPLQKQLSKYLPNLIKVTLKNFMNIEHNFQNLTELSIKATGCLMYMKFDFMLIFIVNLKEWSTQLYPMIRD